ncbi:MAG: hypothetical protein VST68_03100 [Nitrospirota bacterium]|nr:hypothetical protein [Nitrospirota bacterium]
MEIDPSSLERIKMFMEFIQRAKQAGTKLSFISTPTEHGDNITATATIDGERQNIGILFWDVSLLQDRGLVDVLDDDDVALGMNITDGMVEDAAQILSFSEAELTKIGRA